MDIKRSDEPSPVFEEEEGKWKTVSESKAEKIMEAKSNEVRRAILELLNYGAMRKYKLAQYIHKILGKKYSRSLIHYHLKKLDEAGLTDTAEDPENKDKYELVYKSAEMRVQLKSKSVPEKAPDLTGQVVRKITKKFEDEKE